jgi:ligand-binding sensor domain-containing protein
MRNFSVATLLFWSLALFAQTPAYLHYGVEDGLSSTMVYCMFQDHKGFMWFGTNNGLSRFDGNRFKIFGIEDGLPDPEVLNLFEDSQERLWISCFQKKPCYLKNGKFFTSENDSLLNTIDAKSGEHDFKEDHDKGIWITWKGPTVYYYKDDRVEHYPMPQLGSGAGLPSITEINGKKILYGSSKIYDFSDPTSPVAIYSKKFYVSPTSPIAIYSKNFNNYLIYPFSYAYKNEIFISHGDLLKRITIGENSLEETITVNELPPSHNRISLIGNGNIWISYDHSLDGSYRIDLEKLTTRQTPKNFLEGRRVSNLLEDREKNIWFSTLNDGLSVMSEKGALIYNKSNTPVFKSDNFTAVALLPDHRLLIGSETGDVYVLENDQVNQVPFKLEFALSRVRQIVVLPDNRWVAVMDNFLYGEKNEKVDSQFLFEKHKINTPKYMFRDARKTWLAHMNGLHNWNDGDEFPNEAISFKRVTAVGKDSENNIWAGGINGLLSERDSFTINWGEKFKAVSGRIIDIKQGSDGQLWVVTAELGLLRVHVQNGEVKATEIINDQLDKKINGIKGIYKADDGNIWLATNNGIYGLNKNLHVRHIDVTDGLPNNDVNSVAIDRNTLWAATVSGLAKIQLKQDKGDGNFATFISGVRYDLNGQATNLDLVNLPDEEIVIPSGATMIDIQLSGLHFRSAGKLTYQYIEEEKLLPLQWLTWGNLINSFSQFLTGRCDTTIVTDAHRYFGVNAQSGSFKTTASAISIDETMSLQPDTRVFTILPFWYETAWFSILVVGVAAFLIWRFIQQHNAAKKFQRAASELQLQAIKAQMNPHFVGNSINAIQQFFYPPDPIRASQYIATFTSLLRQSMYLSEVPFIPFSQEKEFITDYLEMVKLRFEDRFEYQIADADKILAATPFPAMILQPILENATIHGLSPEGLSIVKIVFNFNGQTLTCSITDNGVGIETSRAFKKNKKGTHLSKGIDLLRKKINVLNKMHALDIKIDFTDLSTLGNGKHGTMVRLSFSPNKIPLPSTNQ